jgi:hypothetical protein
VTEVEVAQSGNDRERCRQGGTLSGPAIHALVRA